MISPAIASLADSALLLPASALLLLFLAILGRFRIAAILALALVLAGAGTIVAKLLFHACGRAITDATVVSPSGHMSFATIFYGAVAILFGAGRPRWARLALGLGAALLVVAVGISRVRTQAHTSAEVAVGFLIGAAALAVFAALQRRAAQPTLPWVPVALCFGLALALLGGRHFSLEYRIRAVARDLSAALDVCGPGERVGLSRFVPAWLDRRRGQATSEPGGEH